MQGLELQWLDGPPLPRRRWALADGFTLGRASSNDLVLPDAGVSRFHACVRLDHRAWRIEDRGSRLGTQVNGIATPSSGAVLHAGDQVAIGPWRFRIARGSPRDANSSGRLLAEQRLELLLRCAGELAAAADEQELADVLAENALAGSGHARAAVFRCDEAGSQSISVRPISRTAGFSADDELLERAAIDGAAAGERTLCVALVLDGRAQALLYLEGRFAGRAEHEDGPTFAHALARLAAFALANLRRIDSARRHAMLAADLERAREVQQRLLPRPDAIAGLRPALHLEPGRAVAGDIADVFVLHGGKVAALLGDVAGTGLGAGLLMASVQSFLRAELAHHDDPARAARCLNAHLCEQAARGRFVTLWLGVFDPATRTCRFVDAGHGLAWRLGARREPMPIAARGGIPLGVDVAAHYDAEHLELGERDCLLLHSDGLTERRAPDGRAFGVGGLAAAVRNAATPRQAIAQALDASERHAAGVAAEDDVTLLALAFPSRG